MYIDNSRMYHISELDKMMGAMTPDDIPDFVGMNVVWPDGEKVQVQIVRDNLLVVPGTMHCARCDSPSDEPLLFVRSEHGFNLIVDAQGNLLADLRTQAYVCNTDEESGGTFIQRDAVGKQHTIIGMILHIQRMIEPAEDADILRVTEQQMKYRPKPGDERWN
jgi:hypothetical protein